MWPFKKKKEENKPIKNEIPFQTSFKMNWHFVDYFGNETKIEAQAGVFNICNMFEAHYGVHLCGYVFCYTEIIKDVDYDRLDSNVSWNLSNLARKHMEELIERQEFNIIRYGLDLPLTARNR